MTASGPLSLSGDLAIEVDGTPVQVHGEGSHLRVVADDVRTFIARAREAAVGRGGALPGRRDLGRLAAELANRGVSASLDSRSGPVLTVGAGVDSTAGVLLFGTRLARPDSAQVLTSTDQGRLALAGAAAGLALLVGLVLRRRRGRTVDPCPTRIWPPSCDVGCGSCPPRPRRRPGGRAGSCRPSSSSAWRPPAA